MQGGRRKAVDGRRSRERNDKREVCFEGSKRSASHVFFSPLRSDTSVSGEISVGGGIDRGRGGKIVNQRWLKPPKAEGYFLLFFSPATMPITIEVTLFFRSFSYNSFAPASPALCTKKPLVRKSNQDRIANTPTRETIKRALPLVTQLQQGCGLSSARVGCGASAVWGVSSDTGGTSYDHRKPPELALSCGVVYRFRKKL